MGKIASNCAVREFTMESTAFGALKDGKIGHGDVVDLIHMVENFVESAGIGGGIADEIDIEGRKLLLSGGPSIGGTVEIDHIIVLNTARRDKRF